MNFEISAFNSLLDGFNSMCDNYAVQTVQTIQKIQTGFVQMCELYKQKEQDLTAQCTIEQDIQLEKLHIKKQFNESQESLDQKMNDIQSQIQQVKQEIQQIKSDMVNANVSMQNQTQFKEKATKQQINPQLKNKYNKYQKMLQMDFELDDQLLTVKFTGIQLSNLKKEFWVKFVQNNDMLEIKETSDQLEGLESFVQESQMTGNLGLLVRRIRRGFLQQYREQK